MSLPFIELETRDAIAHVTLNKSPINALDESTLQQHTQAADQVEQDPAIRAVIIASAVPNVFCAGGDLKYWPRVYKDQPEVISLLGRATFERIERLTKPSVAAIEGHVIGDGLALALACDLRVASQDATFQLPEISYGFIPGWGTIGRLMQAVGTAHATELLLLGERISADHAQRIGLVHRVAASGNVTSIVESLAARLAGQPPIAVRYAKAALRGRWNRAFDQMDWEARCFASTWGNSEWAQGAERLFKTAR